MRLRQPPNVVDEATFGPTPPLVAAGRLSMAGEQASSGEQRAGCTIDHPESLHDAKDALTGRRTSYPRLEVQL